MKDCDLESQALGDHWLRLSVFAGRLATIWLPIPTGVPLLAIGSFLLIANSRAGRNMVRRMRKQIDWLNRALVWLEERAGRPFDRVLKTTRPLMTRHRRKRETEAGLSHQTRENEQTPENSV